MPGDRPDRPQPVARLVLASGSPRRRELLAGLGLDFSVRPVDLDETPLPGELPEPYVLRLARAKATHRGEPGEVVLAADTVVALHEDSPEEGPPGEALLGKPEDEEDARRMLRRLSGREHRVFTGVAVWDPGRDRLEAGVEVTRVAFAAMDRDEIGWYTASGEPLDRAGAYAIQGLAALFVEGITGNYSNVVGLPLPLVYRLTRAVGVDFKALSRRT